MKKKIKERKEINKFDKIKIAHLAISLILLIVAQLLIFKGLFPLQIIQAELSMASILIFYQLPSYSIALLGISGIVTGYIDSSGSLSADTIKYIIIALIGLGLIIVELTAIKRKSTKPSLSINNKISKLNIILSISATIFMVTSLMRYSNTESLEYSVVTATAIMYVVLTLILSPQAVFYKLINQIIMLIYCPLILGLADMAQEAEEVLNLKFQAIQMFIMIIATVISIASWIKKNKT